jgi:molybdate transport system ATP-binding protein
VTQDVTRHAALVEIALPDGAFLARVTPDAISRLGLSPGAPVLALIKSVAIEVLVGHGAEPMTPKQVSGSA